MMGDERNSRVLLLASGAALATALIDFLLLSNAPSPRARLNIVQAGATVFFVAAGLRSSLPGKCDQTKAKAPFGLWLPLLTGAMVWSFILPSYFIGDDFELLGLAKRPLIPTLWDLTVHGQRGAFLRPIGFASIFLDYRMYGFQPAGYHATNVLIHLACVAGAYFLARELRFGARFASFAALIFAVLPIEAEAVSWIGARFDLLSALFVIWGIFFYIKSRAAGAVRLYVLALVCFLLAVLSKENAFVFPLLALAAEFLVVPRRDWRALGGCFVLAAAVFGYRWIILGGIGGYVDPKGAPMALHAGWKVLEGLFLRCPSLTTFGINWDQPKLAAAVLLFSVTHGTLLAVTIASQGFVRSGRLFWFGLAWMVIPLLPVHPFLLMTPDLRTSRILYLGSLGEAMVVAQLLSGIEARRVRSGAAILLTVLLSAAAIHNMGAWRYCADLERRFLDDVRANPAPPANAEVVFDGLPRQVRGIDFHAAGLPEAMQFIYGRHDVSGVRSDDPMRRAAGSDRPEIHLRWMGAEGKVVVGF